jgi:hypothetical protein
MHGYRISSINSTPEYVTVEGNAESIPFIDAIKTSYISVSDLRDNKTFTVNFQPYDDIKFIEPSEVKVNVGIVADIVVKQYSVTVHCLSGTGSNGLELPVVSLNITGRRDVLESIPPHTQFAYIDCERLSAGGNVPVIAAEIAKVKIWGISPEYVGSENENALP